MPPIIVPVIHGDPRPLLSLPATPTAPLDLPPTVPVVLDVETLRAAEGVDGSSAIHQMLGVREQLTIREPADAPSGRPVHTAVIPQRLFDPNLQGCSSPVWAFVPLPRTPQ